jgi:hypothetical protein
MILGFSANLAIARFSAARPLALHAGNSQYITFYEVAMKRFSFRSVVAGAR